MSPVSCVVKVFVPPTVVMLPDPAIVTFPSTSGTTGFVPESGTNESIASPPPSNATVTVLPVAEVTIPAPPAISIAPADGVAVPVSAVSSVRIESPAKSSPRSLDNTATCRERS